MSLEHQLTRDMINMYQRAKKECGYNATRFVQMVTDQGGLTAAKRLINNDAPSDGFVTLWERKRLDLTVEALILTKKEYRSLFTEEERNKARNRLIQYGYEI